MKSNSAKKHKATKGSSTSQKQPKQLGLLKKQTLSYGGELLKTRKGRSHGRPLDTKNTIHLVLRSSKAIGDWSFRTPTNSKKIRDIVAKFSQKYAVQILSLANVGNHLHLQIKLAKRQTYRPFIRAVTSAIAMSVTGVNRWTKAHLNLSRSMQVNLHGQRSPRGQIDRSEKVRGVKALEENSAEKSTNPTDKLKFWDYRPFTRVVRSYMGFLKLKDYILINELEGYGVKRSSARLIIAQEGAAWAQRFLFARI